MNGIDPEVLLGELEKGHTVITKVYSFFEKSLKEDVPKLGRKQSAAVFLSGIIDNYYTGLETAFLKIH